MVVYSLTLTSEYWNSFQPKKRPIAPDGWEEAHTIYECSAKSEKSDKWRGMLEKFGGYIKAKQEAEIKNNGEVVFLKEMLCFFEGRLMYPQVAQVRQKVNEYLSETERLGCIR